MKKYIALTTLLFWFLTSSPALANRMYTVGFEQQTITDGEELRDFYGTTSSQIDTTIKHSGLASHEVSGDITTGAVAGANMAGTACTACYIRWYFYVDALPDSPDTPVFFDGLTSGAVNVFSAQGVNSAGTITVTVFYNAFASSLPTTFNIGFDGWHYLEAYYDSTPADGSEVLTIRYDGSVVSSATNLTFTNKSLALFQWGVYNGTAGTINTEIVYFDDMAANNTTGSSQTSYPGAGNIAMLVPTAAGDDTPSGCNNTSPCADPTNSFQQVDETNPDDATSFVDLDEIYSSASYNFTDTSTAGIDSYDTISLVHLYTRQREETSTTTLYQSFLKSASGGTKLKSSAVDQGSTTWRTSPAAADNDMLNSLPSYTDPTTGVAWTPTGTNSVDNIIGGGGLTTDNSDIDVTTMWINVEYVDGTAPAPSGAKVDNFILIYEQ